MALKRLFAAGARVVISVLAIAAAAGCGPQAVLFDVDVYDNGSFNLDPEIGRISVFAVTPDTRFDSTAITSAASALAAGYESAQNLEESTVATYSIPAAEFTSLRDTAYIESLMTDSGSRVMIFMKDLRFGETAVSRDIFGETTDAELPFRVELVVFDAVRDSVLFYYNRPDTAYIYVNADLPKPEIDKAIIRKIDAVSSDIGKGLARNLSTLWKTESWMIIDYPDEDIWHGATLDAGNFRWKDAIEKWLPYTENENLKKASYASFNIAVACEMLDNTALAKQWLNYSIEKYSFPEAEALMKHLDSKK